MIVYSDFLLRLHEKFYDIAKPGTYLIIAMIVTHHAMNNSSYDDLKASWMDNYTVLLNSGLKAELLTVLAAFSDKGIISIENYAMFQDEIKRMGIYGNVTFKVSDLLWATYRCVKEE